MEKITASIVSILLCVHVCPAQNWNIDALAHIHTRRNTALDKPLTIISGSAPYIFAATPLVYYSVAAVQCNKLKQQQAIGALIGFGINGLITYTAKKAIDKPRPGATYPQLITPLVPLYQHSMPSGHSSLSFWWATSVSMAKPKWYITTPVWLLATTTAYSRMHMGVHYPTDILVGAAIGTASALVSRPVNKWLQGYSKTKPYYQKAVF